MAKKAPQKSPKPESQRKRQPSSEGKANQAAQSKGDASDQGPGVVTNRFVVVRPMTLEERAALRGEAPAVPETAPKPNARNEYQPRMVQMRPKRRRPGTDPKPAGMSDVKF